MNGDVIAVEHDGAHVVEQHTLARCCLREDIAYVSLAVCRVGVDHSETAVSRHRHRRDVGTRVRLPATDVNDVLHGVAGLVERARNVDVKMSYIDVVERAARARAAVFVGIGVVDGSDSTGGRRKRQPDTEDQRTKSRESNRHLHAAITDGSLTVPHRSPKDKPAARAIQYDVLAVPLPAPPPPRTSSG